MSKFMQIAGILAAAVGVAVGLMVFFSLGEAQIRGLTPETSALLLMGGLLSIGVGGVIASIEESTRATREMRDWLAGHEAPPLYEPEPMAESYVAPAVAAAAATVLATVDVPREPAPERPHDDFRSRADAEIEAARTRAEDNIDHAKASTEETLASLDQAKADIAQALDLEPAPEPITEPAAEGVAEPEPEAEAEAEVEPEEEPDEGDEQLYVVEERMIRGRPARVLSDGTVEAETDEGWMRFENLEHLEEYLDAMSPAKV